MAFIQSNIKLIIFRARDKNRNLIIAIYADADAMSKD